MGCGKSGGVGVFFSLLGNEVPVEEGELPADGGANLSSTRCSSDGADRGLPGKAHLGVWDGIRLRDRIGPLTPSSPRRRGTVGAPTAVRPALLRYGAIIWGYLAAVCTSRPIVVLHCHPATPSMRPRSLDFATLRADSFSSRDRIGCRCDPKNEGRIGWWRQTLG